MSIPTRRMLGLAAAATALVITLAGCGGGAPKSGHSTSAASGATQITDNFGPQTVPSPPQRVVVTDNHFFRTVEQWGITPVAAPKGIMADDVSYKKNNKVVDLGFHHEPKLENLVAANPDLVINGYRFAKQQDQIKKLVPEAAVIDLSPQEGKPLVDELKRGTTVLAEIFDKKAEAEELNKGLDGAIANAKKAYNGKDTVLSVLTSGGKISFVAPSTGRSIGPVYDILGLKPALQAKAGDKSHGDDISVEAIAQAKPQWLLVMDRDASIAGAREASEYKPAKDLIESNPALKNVPAIQKKQIIYLPANFYLTEDIQAYTELLNSIGTAFGAAKS